MLDGVLVGAVSDVHSPKFYDDFKRVLNNSPDVDLMLLAGDMIYKGRVEEYEKVIDAIESRLSCRIVACFGNEEYDDKLDDIMARYSKVLWLNDELAEIELSNHKLVVVGTKGCLDRPTSWQRKHIPNIAQLYEQRLKRIDELLQEASKKGFTILISHYAITYKTLVGEPKWAWPEMGSAKLEEVIKRRKPPVAIHGHAHNGKLFHTVIDGVQVYNVSFPATRKITVIKVLEGEMAPARQVSLTHFLKR